MKRALDLIIGIVIIGMSILVFPGCNSAKYSSDFKKQKKQTESLVIISPFVSVIADNNKTYYVDTALSSKNQILIEVITTDLLSSKYKLEKKKLAKLEHNIFTSIDSKINDSSKSIAGIKCDSIVNAIEGEFQSKFALLMIYNGKINPDFGPHHNFKAGIVSNSVIIAPHTKAKSELQLMVIDTEIKEIVFFDKINTSNFDPRVESEIEQITKKILRKIYYK